MPMNTDGIENAAILLLAIGEAEAAAVFKHLSPREVKRLSATIATMPRQTREHIADVLAAFRLDADKYGALSIGSDDYVRSVLSKALGDDNAERLLQDILQGEGVGNGLDALNWMDANEVAELVRDEHPQITTAVIAHLERGRAAEVLAHFEPALRNDVILRVATFGGVQPTALEDLTDVLSNLLSHEALRANRTDGLRTATELLNSLPGTQEQAAIASLREHDAELAQRIVERMFTFDNLLQAEDAGIRRLLEVIEESALMVALKTADTEMRTKFTRNMSQRAGENLIEDIEMSGPVRVAQVEEAQRKILQAARRLIEAGQLPMQGRDDDVYV
jgi:flagellar motor switch protein FliG